MRPKDIALSWSMSIFGNWSTGGFFCSLLPSQKFSYITNQKAGAAVSKLDGLRKRRVVPGTAPHRVQMYVEQNRKRFGRNARLVRKFCKLADRCLNDGQDRLHVFRSLHPSN